MNSNSSKSSRLILNEDGVRFKRMNWIRTIETRQADTYK